MAQSVIVDTSALVALIVRDDRYHAWALAQSREWPRPWLTCEAAVSEMFFFLRRVGPHVLIDLDGHSYMEPCTPPSQTEVTQPKFGPPCAPLPPKGHDPNVPLEIHYTDQPDPGC